MTTIPWDYTLAPTSCALYLEHKTATFENPFTYQQQVLARGVRWRAELTITDRGKDKAGKIDAALSKMRGGANTAVIPDWRRAEPVGAGAPPVASDFFSDGTRFTDGTVAVSNGPRVADGSQTGAQLLTTGWTANTLVLAAGDSVNLGPNKLHRAVSDTYSDAAGRACIEVEPPVRVAPGDGQLVTTHYAGARFRLVDGQQGKNTTRAPALSSYSVTLVQDID